MMFKTVNFNIFEENLQDIVYGEDTASRAEKNRSAERNAENITRKSTEIIIKPLTDTRLEVERKRT